MNKRNFYKWWIVIACTIINGCSLGVFNYAFTAFFNPIADEFQWSYALVSLAFSFRGFEAGIAAPIVGFLCDKVGPKMLFFWGSIITGLGFGLVAATQNLLSFYLIFFFLGIGISLCGAIVGMALIVNWFGKQSSMPMGILMAGIAIGGLATPVISTLIDNYGWRDTAIILGIAFWIICIPLVLSLKNFPATSQSTTEDSGKHVDNPVTTEISARQILRNKTIWKLSLVIFFSGVAGTAVSVHQMPHCIDLGILRQSAAFSVSVFAVANISGRLLFGAIGDRVNKSGAYTIATAMISTGVLLFGLGSDLAAIISAVIIIGIGYGGIQPIRPGIQIQMFGHEKFASIQGILVIAITLGALVSPLFAGWMFDITGNYQLAFILLSIITLLAIPILIALPKEKQTL